MTTFEDYRAYRDRLSAQGIRGTAGDDCRAFPRDSLQQLLEWGRRYQNHLDALRLQNEPPPRLNPPYGYPPNLPDGP